MNFRILPTLATLLLALTCAPSARSEILFSDHPTISSNSGIPAYQWMDRAGKPKAVAVVMHGFTQQGLSVAPLAQKLAKDGYLVISLDQRGHGRWHFGKDKALAPIVDYNRSVDDMLKVCRAARNEYPDLPLFCVGESAGAAVVERVVSKDPKLADGIVLCSPGTRPRVYNLFWMTRDFICNIWRLNHPIDVRRYMERYASDDPQVVSEMLSDPMCRYMLSGREILGTAKFLVETPWKSRHLSSSIPILVVQGNIDHILSPHSVHRLLKHMHGQSSEVVLLPQAGHVLLGTALKPAVCNTIENWLDGRVLLTHGTVHAQLLHTSKSDQIPAMTPLARSEQLSGTGVSPQ